MEPDDNATPTQPAIPDAEFVEVERMDGGGIGEERSFSTPGGGIQFRSFTSTGPNITMPKPPTIAAWLCLLAAWFFLGSRVPFTVFIGLPINLAAIILSIICLARGGMFTGLMVLLLGTIGSLVVYLVGVFRFLSIA